MVFRYFGLIPTVRKNVINYPHLFARKFALDLTNLIQVSIDLRAFFLTKISRQFMTFFLAIGISLISTACLMANPSNHQVITGDVGLDASVSKALHITASDRAIIEWKDFSINEGELTQFIQPHAKAAVLNRVTGDQMSQLMGTLKANGQVFLINPQGIVIGQQALIDTASFIASTLDITNEEFLKNGEMTFKGFSEKPVVNLGMINAWDGDILLIGFSVKNDGVLKAPHGTAAIAAGQEVLLQPLDKEKIFIRPSSSASSGTGIEHNGKIEALEAQLKADGNLYAIAINSTGEIDATAVSEEGGRIFLIADEGRIEVASKIHVPGGAVTILGEEVILKDAAFIDVSGDKGGGTALVGDASSTRVVYVGKDVRINADAKVEGDGGRVIVWGHEYCGFFGAISARGGDVSGDGGFVEVSGKGHFFTEGTVDTLAPFGQVGTLLFDPCDVTISTGADTNIMTPPPPGYTFTPALTANINIGNLTTLVTGYLSTGNVTINATTSGTSPFSRITVVNPFSWTSVSAAGTKLTMIAQDTPAHPSSGIFINADIKALQTTAAPGTVVMDFTGSVIKIIPSTAAGVSVNASSGTIKITATGGAAPTLDIEGGSLNNAQTTVSAQAGGNIMVQADSILLKGGTGLSANAEVSTSGLTGQGDITVNTTGDITITSTVSSSLARFFAASGGDVTITSTNGHLTLNNLGPPGGTVQIVSQGGGVVGINLLGADKNLTLLSNGGLAAIDNNNGGPIFCNIQGDYLIQAIAGGIVRIITGQTGGPGDIIMSGRNLTLMGPGTALITPNGGSLTLTMSNDITVDGGTIQNLLAGLATDMDIVAGNNIVIQNSSTIGTVGPGGYLNLVVDNDFPTAPGIGPGGFTLDATSSIATAGGGLLGIYTATFPQNSISGTLNINGTTYTGSTDPQNQFFIYYPAGTIVAPFSMFFKVAIPVPPSPAPAPFVSLPLPVSRFGAFTWEMLYDFQRFDTPAISSPEFLMVYPDQQMPFFFHNQTFIKNL